MINCKPHFIPFNSSVFPNLSPPASLLIKNKKINPQTKSNKTKSRLSPLSETCICMNIGPSSRTRFASGVGSDNSEENRLPIPPITLGWEFVNTSTIHNEILAVLSLCRSYECKHCFPAYFYYFWFIKSFCSFHYDP